MADTAAVGKNSFALIMMILVGVVLGGLIAQFSAGIPALSWLSYGQVFGITDPIVLDLGIIALTFGFSIKLTIASIAGIIVALVAYRFF